MRVDVLTRYEHFTVKTQGLIQGSPGVRNPPLPLGATLPPYFKDTHNEMMFSDARVAPPGLTLCPACTPPVNKILDPPLRLESQTRVFPLLVKSSQCIEKPEFTSPDTKITDLAFSGHLREK